MSFFYDVLDDFNVKNLKTETIISFILNKGVHILGNIKLLNFSENEISIESNNEYIKISGENLIVKMISKGEIEINGYINLISRSKDDK